MEEICVGLQGAEYTNEQMKEQGRNVQRVEGQGGMWELCIQKRGVDGYNAGVETID